ncbi:hypothetical protein BpHYR1_039108 [Brachionus plicatilis]|uniref:Uncharacterized protein n=1 Tax=Brachionus plicatilis TaxID=10195 RepID=A0A3M7Q2Z3_BRAPC|nr:hypothetical protein BpHYR1_039108 [Brachionus plicatilis]
MFGLKLLQKKIQKKCYKIKSDQYQVYFLSLFEFDRHDKKGIHLELKTLEKEFLESLFYDNIQMIDQANRIKNSLKKPSQ